MKIKRIAYLFCCLCLYQFANAQVISQDYNLKWHPPFTEKISDEIIRRYIYFDDAKQMEEEKIMPLFWCKIPVSSENFEQNIVISNALWEVLSSEELELLDRKQIDDTLKINSYIEQTRKVPFVKVEFFPFRKKGNRYEKLVSFRMDCILTSISPKRTQKSGTYAENSILRSGNFYKMAITHTGIHRITYADLTALGIGTPISTSNVAVFGNGGRMLPESTSKSVPDDLQEIAIQIIDQNGNGILDDGDYILFYGIGITNWNEFNQLYFDQKFEHEFNIYSTQAFYFVSVDAGVGEKKRVANAALSASSPTHSVNSYYFRDVYEKDLMNIRELSRIWVGEEFNAVTSYKYPFSIPGRLMDKKVFIKIQAASSSPSSSAKFTANMNGVASFDLNFAAGEKHESFTFNNTISGGENIDLNLSYSKPTNNAIGYLDYIEIHTVCALAQNAGQVSFRNPETVGIGNVTEYQFDTKGKNAQIWDVTEPFNPKRINVSTNQGKITYSMSTDILREFFAFDGSSFFSVTPIGKISNQNLHALKDLDFIIITHPIFLQAAEKLAAFRRSNDNMKTVVVTTNQVYYEFGSGIGDISAIRNFLKMFYERGNEHTIPKNVLLFGKTSFDPRDITKTNSCLIPNYQGYDLFSDKSCKTTDNFFAKLADGKGLGNLGSMDMGIGRFSVVNTSQAAIMVDKSIMYASMKDLIDGSNVEYVSNMGDWRNIISFVTDDNSDKEEHLKNAENVCEYILPDVPFINFDKIYSDAYVFVSSANGKRYPAVNNAINSRVNRGCLMMSYFGHGGDNGWSHERILQRSDIFSWKNKYCLPFFFTGCCRFATYDKKTGTSPGEDISLRSDGGAIGLITSTRDSGSPGNEALGKQINKRAFEQTDNIYLTLGEIHAKSQNGVGGYEMYVLLGDPSVTLAHPKWNVITDSINGIAVSAYTDTIKSLQYITISGHISDYSGNKAHDFNGWIYPTVFDKQDMVTTLNPPTEQFAEQKNVLFKGKSKVTNGSFSFRFIVPKDINHKIGSGKISYYAKSDGMDACGYAYALIGGSYDTVFNDVQGPLIRLYLNNEKFVSGGITDPNPVIIAKLSDETGINTASSGIGHDIVAIIDNNSAKSIPLNDYFEFDTNSFTSGSLKYPLHDLAEGKHTLTLRAWDVLNNVSETTIDFEVVNNQNIEIKHVLNYPNPFTTSTQFFFEHNRPNAPLVAWIQIMTISGKVVKTIIQNQQSTGYRSDPIHWNGLDDFGDKLAKGVYIYKLKVIAPDGSSAEKIEKLVIL